MQDPNRIETLNSKNLSPKIIRTAIIVTVLLAISSSASAQVYPADCDRDRWAGWFDEPFTNAFSCSLAPRDSTGSAKIFPEPPLMEVLVTLSGGYWFGVDEYATLGDASCSPQNFSPVLRIHFSQPVRNVRVIAYGNALTATNNVGETITVAGGLPQGRDIQFVSSGITDVTFTNNAFNADGSWYMGIDRVSVRLDPTVCAFLNDEVNAGQTNCNGRVGAPINVTNGNMYLQQTDYSLPGVGPGINITRTYNSISSGTGLFGKGWSSDYDEKINVLNSTNVRWFRADGQATTFTRSTDSDPFSAVQTDFHGTLTRNVDNSFTLAFQDGSVHRFTPTGKLLSLIDRVGNQTSLNYDVNGRLTSIIDPFGRVANVTTNSNGRVLSLSDTLGTIASYTYGTSSELLSTTYPDSSKFNFSYTTTNGNLVLATVTDALGNIVETHSYDAQGRALTSQKQGGAERYTLNFVSATETDVTDALNHVSKYFFDKTRARNLVTQVQGLCSCSSGSQTQSWTYDSQLNVISHTTALGQTATYTYDANGNQLNATGVLGTSSFTYNEFGEVLTATDAMNGVTTNTYDATGNLLSVKDALNNTTAFTYDARGQLLTLTNALGKVTTLTWDTSGRPTQVKDALNNTTGLAYDARARLTNATDALNFTRSYAYDAAGRLNKITRADGSFITYTYDLAGRRTKLTDALNNNTTFAYDGAYRLTGVTDAARKSVSYAYDLMSNLTGATDQLGHTTNIQYDAFNRPVTTIYPPAVTGATRLQETVEYDAGGNVTRRTDTAGRVTTFAYDNANRLISVTDPALQMTQYEYDTRSNVTAVIDSLGQRYTFDYDALSRLTSTTRAGTMMSFAYDAVGNRIQRTDYNQMSTNYTYDSLNRLIQTTYPDASVVSYAYDKLSQMTSATNSNGIVSFVYDRLGRSTSTTDVWGQVINYTYDANSRRTSMAFGTTTKATYTYDAVNRLTKIADDANNIVSFAYDAANNVTSRGLPNSVSTTYTYDGMDRLTRLKDAKASTIIADNNYSYSNAGQITQNIDQSGTHVYGYDAFDRLTSATYTGTAAESYTYDVVGNRTSSQRSASYSYQPFNRLSATSTAGYLYDNNGNMMTKTQGAATTQFAWDFENRLTQVVTPTSGSVTYKYDALGRRVQHLPSTGASTNFIYDGQDVAQDRTSAGVITEYLNGPGSDHKIRQKTGTTLYYFAEDYLGSTTALTDSRGALVERQTYDAYGNSTGSTRTRYGFTGRERDSLTELQYNRARFYDPQLGRFISEDPVGLAGGVNQFAYVSNNPQNATDPSGLYEMDVHYYLTHYLAVKTGCFSESQARQIANGDQNTDDKEEYSPGPMKAYQNATYHALHPGSNEPYLDSLWAKATAGSGSLDWLGRYMHYSQDTFSHAGFTDSNWGHSPVSLVFGNRPGTHAADKTNVDVNKAQQMVAATWSALKRFANEKCNCNPVWRPGMWDTTNRFLNAPTGPGWVQALATLDPSDPLYGAYTWGYLENRRRILVESPR